MGNFAVQRQALVDAQSYMREWDAYNEKVKKGDKDATPPKRDLKQEALAEVLRPTCWCRFIAIAPMNC